MTTFKHLEQQRQHRSGALVYYAKVNGHRVRLRATFGTRQFAGEYAAAVAHLKNKAPPATRHCEHCSKPFQAARPWARYCSSACRLAAYAGERQANHIKAKAALRAIAKGLATVEQALSNTLDAPALASVRRALKRARASIS